MIAKIVALLIVILLIVGVQDYLRLHWGYNRHKTGNLSVIPTLFIHGYQGNIYSLGHMMQRLQHRFHARKEMIIFVKSNGELKVKGRLSHQEKRPLIQIIFKNNTATELRQRDWIVNVVDYLKKQEQVEALNAVAHSMGGVSLLHYLISRTFPFGPQTADLEDYPRFEKVVTIGVPFNDISVGKDTPDAEVYELTENGPRKTTKRYDYFGKKMPRLPQNLEILNIAGDTSEPSEVSGDGSVNVDSAFSLRYLVQPYINTYREYLVQGRRAAHRLLHENRDVDQAVGRFLWRE